MSTQVHREALQRQTQCDWANREYIELISGSIKRIADFLNAFDMSCRSRLSTLNEKLESLERKVDYLEATVTKNNSGAGYQENGQETLEDQPTTLVLQGAPTANNISMA